MFTPKFFTSVLTAIATVPLALSASLFAPEAKANQNFDFCTTRSGIQMCANYGSYYDEVVIAAGNEYEAFQVRCTASRNIFRSRGHLSEYQAQKFVDGYCEGRRGY